MEWSGWFFSEKGVYTSYTPAPISTLAWTVEFTDVPLPTRGDAFVQYLAQTDFSTQGYAHIRSCTWRDDGALLAIGRQTVAIFA